MVDYTGQVFTDEFYHWIAEHDRQVEIAVIEKLADEFEKASYPHTELAHRFAGYYAGSRDTYQGVVRDLREQAQKRREGENDE